LSNRWIESVVGTRRVSHAEVEIGQSVQVAVQVRSRAARWIPWLLVEDLLPAAALYDPPVALERHGPNLRLMRLHSSAPALLGYRLVAKRRGFYQIGPTLAETGDLFGLFRRYAVVEPAQPLLVLAPIVPLEGYDIQSRRPQGEIHVTYRLMEDPTLVAGIRDYQPGDPLRQVHWAATARTGRLHSKIYQPTSVAGAMVVLDLHRDTHPAGDEPVRSDLAITAAASLTHTLCQMQQPFGLLTNGRDAADRLRIEASRRQSVTPRYASREEAQAALRMHAESQRLQPCWVPSGGGEEHFSQLHRTLSRLELTDGLHLSELLLEARHRVPHDTSVIVILRRVDDDTRLALGLLRRQGLAVSAIVNQYHGEEAERASGQLLSQGIAVYHLHDETSLPTICRQVLLRY
jgi:uncharacterized protein (DUF58 family)